MGSNALGGGILFAIVALLWIAVLAPSFARGREFRAAEQNAARLQRTIRLLAETAAIPEEHVVEAKARDALAYEKKLKSTKKYLEQTRKQEVAQLRAEQKRQLLENRRRIQEQETLIRRERMRSDKLKPLRFVVALVVVLSMVGTIAGLILLAAGNGSLLLLSSLLGIGVSVSTLVLIAPGARKKVANRVEPIHKLLPAEEPEFKDLAPEVVPPKESDYRAAQAKAAEEIQRAKALARVRAEARAVAAESKAPKRNMTGSMFLTPEKAAQKSTQGTSSKQNENREDKKPAAENSSKIEQRLREMGVVEEAPVASIDDMLNKRRNAG